MPSWRGLYRKPPKFRQSKTTVRGITPTTDIWGFAIPPWCAHRDSHWVSIKEPLGISVRRVFDQFSVSLRLPFGGVVGQYSKFFLRRTYRSNTMNESTINLAHIEEDILHYDVSDQALEAAAGMPEGKAASFTVAFCTGLDTCPR